MAKPPKVEIRARIESPWKIHSIAVNDDGCVLMGHEVDAPGPRSAHAVSLMRGGKQRWSTPADWPYAVAIANDGACYYAVRNWPDGGAHGGSTLHALSFEDGTERARTELPFDQVSSIALSPDGSSLATVGDHKDQAPRLFATNDLAAPPRKAMKANKGGKMEQLLWSVDGRWLGSIARKRNPKPAMTIAVREPSARAALWHGVADNAIACPDDHILTFTRGATVELWSIHQEQPLRSVTIDQIRSVTHNLALLGGGTHVAIGCFESIMVLSLPTLAITGTFWVDQTSPRLDASQNGKHLLVRDSRTDTSAALVSTDQLLGA
ncbi:WD40 repeat domain-containing protein [Paraliomyxa miuraensis]|uniref:hypothetical protein n=1 Tax=Paraliomyxa miuraensis TaxID=376150 RepID=UPI0022505D19|nr:hypothetical protein [Paraliomyxa miuraensis]MCX4247497.1 hypothetical protein [Paraliomyxa miuraensis]